MTKALQDFQIAQDEPEFPDMSADEIYIFNHPRYIEVTPENLAISMAVSVLKCARPLLDKVKLLDDGVTIETDLTLKFLKSMHRGLVGQIMSGGDPKFLGIFDGEARIEVSSIPEVCGVSTSEVLNNQTREVVNYSVFGLSEFLLDMVAQNLNSETGYHSDRVPPLGIPKAFYDGLVALVAEGLRKLDNLPNQTLTSKSSEFRIDGH